MTLSISYSELFFQKSIQERELSMKEVADVQGKSKGNGESPASAL